MYLVAFLLCAIAFSLTPEAENQRLKQTNRALLNALKEMNVGDAGCADTMTQLGATCATAKGWFAPNHCDYDYFMNDGPCKCMCPDGKTEAEVARGNVWTCCWSDCQYRSVGYDCGPKPVEESGAQRIYCCRDGCKYRVVGYRCAESETSVGGSEADVGGWEKVGGKWVETDDEPAAGSGYECTHEKIYKQGRCKAADDESECLAVATMSGFPPKKGEPGSQGCVWQSNEEAEVARGNVWTCCWSDCQYRSVGYDCGPKPVEESGSQRIKCCSDGCKYRVVGYRCAESETSVGGSGKLRF